MSFLNKIEPNVPKVALESYFMVLHAPSKFGKSTFAYELAKKHYKGDLSKMLLIATESGFNALNGVYAVKVNDFKDGDEDLDTRGFVEVVDELIENKKDVPFKMIVIDTLSALEDLAEKEVIRQQKRKGKQISTIGELAYGIGYNLVEGLVDEQITRLRQAGYGVLVIAHSKMKKVELQDGTSYEFATLNALGKVMDVITREADFIIYGDITTTHNEGVVSSKRELVFRSANGHLCGTRFKHMPNRIDFDIDLFLETFEEAVQGNFDEEINIDEMREEELQAREDKADKFLERNSVPKTDVIAEITEVISAMKKTQKLEAKKLAESTLGTMNFDEVTDTSLLVKFLEAVKQI
jgi:hypothetical protein